MPLSHPLPVLVESGLTPGESLARDRFLLDAVVVHPERWPAALRVYDVVGEVVSIGRWQLAPVPAAAAGVTLMRRHSGGRAAAFGAGFVGVTLVLPTRGGLVDPAAAALRPDQVLNRYVRGILGGLERHGVPALYPGRDTITVRRRQLGVVAFTETRTGTVLVEAILASGGDPSALPRLLDGADPGGVVRATMLQPSDMTSIAAEQGAAPSVAELADLLAVGYAQRLRAAPAARTLGDDEVAAVRELASTALGDESWLGTRRPRADLDRHASAATMLGALDVHLALTPDGRVRDACISGELIAADETIPALEQALSGGAADRTAVNAAVGRVLADPRQFLLGIGPADTLVDTVMRALA